MSKLLKDLMEKKAVKAEQTDEPASQDEAGMAMDQAKFIGYVSKEIMEYLQGNNEFPEWMQNKLTGFHEKAKDMHAVMAGKYESVEESLNEANYQVKAGKAAIGSASYDDKEIVTITPQQAKKLTSYFQKNKDGDMWKKLFQGGGKGGKGAENQKDFDSMVAGLKESTELAEAKVTDTQINKVLGPTKNAQQGIEALKKAFKVNDDEAKAMIKRVMPTEANRGSDSYRVKYKGDINTVRADSPEDALKKSMKAFGIGSMNKTDYMKNASAISEAIDMSKAGKYARVMDPKTREIKKVLKTDLKKYVDKGWTHMTQLKNRLTKEEALEEKLEVSDGLDQWIKDFQASDAPQFKDQSKEERRNMAIAAYLSAKRKLKKGGKETEESTKAYGKSMDKSMDDKKKANISSKDKKTLSKLADLMAKEKGKK